MSHPLLLFILTACLCTRSAWGKQCLAMPLGKGRSWIDFISGWFHRLRFNFNHYTLQAPVSLNHSSKEAPLSCYYNLSPESSNGNYKSSFKRLGLLFYCFLIIFLRLQVLFEREGKVLCWSFTLFPFQKATPESDGHQTSQCYRYSWTGEHGLESRVYSPTLYWTCHPVTGNTAGQWWNSAPSPDLLPPSLSSHSPERALLRLFLGPFLD